MCGLVTALILIAVSRADAEPPAAADTNRLAAADMLLAPFSSQRADFFDAALGVPRLERAETLPPHTTYLRLRTERSYSTRGPTMSSEAERRSYVQGHVLSGQPVQDIFAGQFNTWLGVELSHGVLPWLEFDARAAFGGWDEHRDNFYFFDKSGAPIVRNEARDIYARGATSRDDDLNDVVLQAKARLLDTGDTLTHNTLSLSGAVKLPLGQPNNLVDAGTTDFSLRLLDSLAVGSFELHANIAGVFPTGSQSLFVRELDAKLDPFLAAGLGLTWEARHDLSFGLQAEGNTSAFRDVPFLDGDVLTVLGGVRKLIGSYVLEAGYGRGLTSASYDWDAFLSLGHPL